jgi:RNase P subunit RPR2
VSDVEIIEARLETCRAKLRKWRLAMERRSPEMHGGVVSSNYRKAQEWVARYEAEAEALLKRHLRMTGGQSSDAVKKAEASIRHDASLRRCPACRRSLPTVAFRWRVPSGSGGSQFVPSTLCLRCNDHNDSNENSREKPERT